jgi:hypothetical protein
VTRLAGLGEGRHQADPGGELVWPREAVPVTDLTGQRQRGQRVNATKRAQAGHDRPQLGVRGDMAEPLGQRVATADEAVHGCHRVDAGELGVGLVKRA